MAIATYACWFDSGLDSIVILNRFPSLPNGNCTDIFFDPSAALVFTDILIDPSSKFIFPTLPIVREYPLLIGYRE